MQFSIFKSDRLIKTDLKPKTRRKTKRPGKPVWPRGKVLG